MRTFLSRIHARLGDLWWYTILLFVAQRIGDVINLFVGLWLVPKYVPQQELGAVLPLTQLVSFIGLPLGILAIPFMKFLGVYAERGEYGKVKSLLRDVFVGTGILAAVTLVMAWLVFPFFFERCRIAKGSLELLIILGSLIGALATIFNNAVQGLKLYDATVWFNLLMAPVRLGVMVITMPFRALSGYFAGQVASPCVPVLGALWALRKRFDKTVRTVPYLREDFGAMLRYTWPIAVWTTVGMISSMVDHLVMRHRLPDFESAGYYVITRFTDIALYFGNAFIVFLFPMVAQMKAKGRESQKILLQSVGGTAAGGAMVGFVLLFTGTWLLELNALWADYASLSRFMLPICLLNALALSCNCLFTYEMAQGRFRFLWYAVPVQGMKCLFLYVTTGVSFFEGMVPASIVDAVNAWKPCSLSFWIGTLLVTHVVFALLLFVDVFGWKGKER